ncbi:MAG: hypothetical protein DSZ03_08995 [Sulfurimonas sp.]|nr:MAG: hypothetical protein DSZ03_08995 [Sulfurimonas sp.]
MKTRLILILLLGVDALILYSELTDLSISYYETQLLYEKHSLLHYIITASLTFFGHNDLALRLPMIVMHLLSVILLFKISEKYLYYDRDRLWLVLIYMLLPGVSSAALIVDPTGMVIFALFFYMYVHHFHRTYEYLLLPLLLFVDQSIAFLYLGLIFFEYANRSYRKMALLVVLLILAFTIHPLEVSGVPSGHFLDTLGVYAAIFSPIVFIYLFYILYRAYMKEYHDISWYLAANALVISLLLSFRQRIEVQIFAPYLMVILPLAVQTFFHSYRVRLKEFRGRYRTVFVLSFILLVLNTLVVFFNKEIYAYLETPKKHFVYKMHVAKELAEALRELNITCILASNDKMQPRLRFYGIEKCEKFLLTQENPFQENAQNVTIRYKNQTVYQGYVTKQHI